MGSVQSHPNNPMPSHQWVRRVQKADSRNASVGSFESAERACQVQPVLSLLGEVSQVSRSTAETDVAGGKWEAFRVIRTIPCLLTSGSDECRRPIRGMRRLALSSQPSEHVRFNRSCRCSVRSLRSHGARLKLTLRAENGKRSESSEQSHAYSPVGQTGAEGRSEECVGWLFRVSRASMSGSTGLVVAW
jgi:hypothetical protein